MRRDCDVTGTTRDSFRCGSDRVERAFATPRNEDVTTPACKLGSKRGATLDDVLLSDAFDRCLELARKGGAVGSLEPLFHNYLDAEVVSM